MNAERYSEGGFDRWRSQKITPRHLDRLAIVYVRQSTLQQVADHQESTRLQYGGFRAAATKTNANKIFNN